ncbi:MAG TPA: HAMP domain-containing sensor histidine kinase [Hymenobacter sp.]|jgi:two-component system sensor histidine kinase VicK
MLEPAAFFLDQADAGPHIQFIYDLVDERIIYVNAAYERVLGGHCALVNEELPALLARLDPDDVPVFERLWRLWKNGGLNEEVEIRLRPGTQPKQPEQWFCLTPHQQRAADGHTWVGGTLSDITTSKLYQEVSDKFQTKKNTVLEILAHDLAGAFVIMQQLTDYVQEELGPDGSPQVLDMLRLMQNTSQHSVEMIHDLMDQEFMESADIPLKRERVDLREKVAQTLEPFRRAPGREARQLVFEAPPEPVYAEIDVNKLLQVVSNLTANALKFTPDTGRITVRVESCAGCVCIVVADEGIGIPEPLQPWVFDRFTKARRRGLRGEPTTGLGLSLCKTIVELHGGTLALTSAEGQGSTFTVELPAEAS